MNEEEKPEKAYNRVPRDIIWWGLNKRNAPRGYIEIIKDLYEGEVASVRTIGEEISEFSVTIGLY